MEVGRMRALIVGATGVVGAAAVEYFLDQGAEVVAVSRRVPQLAGGRQVEHLPLDLLDAASSAAALAKQTGITHVVYAALNELPGLIAGWRDQQQIDNNDAMLRGVIEPLLANGAPLEHVSLLQGTKAYGFHLGEDVHRMRVPSKESQPRVEHPNFYWVQQDFLTEAAERGGFAFTVWRPQFIFGNAAGAAMNLIPVIGAYAALCAKLGEPFSYPGGHSYVAEAVDSRLLASALFWAATASTARNEIFNITNGDVFEWRDLWPAFGEMLGVEVGPDERRSLAEWLPQHAEAWDEIVAEHGLQPTPLMDLLGQGHYYADNAFAWTADGSQLSARIHPVLESTIKLRKAGFQDCIDTEEMFRYWFERIRSERIIP